MSINKSEIIICITNKVIIESKKFRCKIIHLKIFSYMITQLSLATLIFILVELLDFSVPLESHPTLRRLKNRRAKYVCRRANGHIHQVKEIYKDTSYLQMSKIIKFLTIS